MSKQKSFHILITALACIWMILFMGAWDKDKPAASTSLRASNPEILANFSALETAIGQDHEFSTGGTNAGKHIQVTFDDPLGSAPATVDVSEGVLYILDVNGKAELHFEDEDENTIQLTSAGDLYSSTGLTVTNNATFNGGITLGADDDLIGSATSDITFDANKFTVAGATGNTVIAGTLDVTGNIDPTTYETTNGGFLDEDDMASDANDKTASQQSIKAYVSDYLNFTPATYDANESVTFPNGLIFKHGEESVGATTTDEVTYETPFPTGLVSAQVSYKGAGLAISQACTVQPKSGSETDILEVTNRDGATRTLYWQAWGY